VKTSLTDLEGSAFDPSLVYTLSHWTPPILGTYENPKSEFLKKLIIIRKYRLGQIYRCSDWPRASNPRVAGRRTSWEENRRAITKSIGKTRRAKLHANRNRVFQNVVWMVESRAPNLSIGESCSLPARTSSHVLRTPFQKWFNNLTEPEHGGGADDLVEFHAVGPENESFHWGRFVTSMMR
jgi:hypothetical protein